MKAFEGCKKPSRASRLAVFSFGCCLTGAPRSLAQSSLPQEASLGVESLPPFRSCGTPPQRASAFAPFGTPYDCDASHTVPSQVYAEGGVYEFRLVFHVIEKGDGSAGQLTDELLISQLDVLNEDFGAKPGSPGASGTDVRFHFGLADVDPEGRPSTGIVRYQSDAWFADTGAYWQSSAWDPSRYINVYSNSASGLLGYTFPPADAESAPGTNSDRIVIHWRSLGRNSSDSNGFDQGRTLTHEVGHYFGLSHTFAPNPTSPETFQCSPDAEPECFETGDLICDTASEEKPAKVCLASESCGSVDPIDNYMNYTPDACLTHFTEQQALRMRCTVKTYRPTLPHPPGSLSTEQGSLAGEPGELLQYHVRLRNGSAEAAVFNLRLASEPPAFPAVIAASGAETLEDIALEPGEDLTVQVNITVPKSAAPGTLSVVQLFAAAGTNALEATLPLRAEVLAKAQLELDLPPPTRAEPLVPGSYPLELSNLGLETEEILVELPEGSGAQFATAASPSVLLTLNSGSSSRLYIEATIPREVSAEGFHDVLVTATPQRRPAAQVSGTLRLVAELLTGASLEPLGLEETAKPGVLLSRTLNVRNQSNAANEFYLRVQNTSGAAEIEVTPHSTGRLGRFGSSKDDFTFNVDLTLLEAAGKRQPVVIVFDVHSADREDRLARTEWRIIPTDVHGVQWLLPRTSFDVEPGKAVHLLAELENEGNVQDEFQVSLLNGGLTLTPTPPSALMLAPGTGKTLEFSIELPDMARAGDLFSAELRAQSNLNKGVQASQELLIRVTAPSPARSDARPQVEQDAGPAERSAPKPDADTATTTDPSDEGNSAHRTTAPGAECGCRSAGSQPESPSRGLVFAMVLGALVRRRRSHGVSAHLISKEALI